MEKVKFYSKEDMASGYNLKCAENIINNFDENKEYYDINELIEFFNITKYIDNGIFLKDWDEKYIQEAKQKNIQMKKYLFKWFNKNINNHTIVNEYEKVEKKYKRDFFTIINSIIDNLSINDNVFKDLLNKCNYHIYDILENKKIVNKYDNVLKDYMNIDIENSTRIFVDVYLIKNNKRKLFIPNSLCKKDKEEIIKKYLNTSNANINYLRLLINAPEMPEFGLSTRTKFAIKQEINKQENELFKNSNTNLSTEYLVKIVPNLDELKKEIYTNQKWILSYSLEWIKNNNDYPTLLNNYIYLFEYVDGQMRWTSTAKKSHLGLFEGHLAMHAKDDYIGGFAFQSLNMIADMQQRAYYEVLNNMGIRLEEVILWFFNKYLRDEFKIEDFRASIPSKNSNYLEKCRFILPEIEGTLKKYDYYLEDGYINHELIDMTTTPIPFENIRSKLNNKYVYPQQNNEDYTLINYALFSNQCMLKYIERINKNYNSFYELLKSEDVTLNDIHEYDISLIDKLKEYNLIYIDCNGLIKILDKKAIIILNDLNKNEVISYWKFPKEYREKITEIVNNNLAYFDSSLLSKIEVNYLNYCLNRKKFINSLDLRNKYDHGTKSSGSEKEHYSNYMRILRLFILIIIKINDELCIFESEEYKNN